MKKFFAFALVVTAVVLTLAVGLSMAFIGVSIWVPAVVIGLVAAAFSVVGLRFGTRLGSQWGRRAEIAGGCVLILIGTRILISHLSP